MAAICARSAPGLAGVRTTHELRTCDQCGYYDRVQGYGEFYFYFLLFMRVFFGSDQRYTPVLLGYVVSFLLFSISLNIGFMSWLYELAQQVPFLSHNVYNFVTAIAVILLANALSASQKMKLAGDILLIIVLPLGVLVAAGIFLPGLLAKIGL